MALWYSHDERYGPVRRARAAKKLSAPIRHADGFSGHHVVLLMRLAQQTATTARRRRRRKRGKKLRRIFQRPTCSERSSTMYDVLLHSFVWTTNTIWCGLPFAMANKPHAKHLQSLSVAVWHMTMQTTDRINNIQGSTHASLSQSFVAHHSKKIIIRLCLINNTTNIY